MTEKEIKKDSLKFHPIQILSVSVKELRIVANQPPDQKVGNEEQGFSLTTGHSEYDNKNHTISVSAQLEMGVKEKEPYNLCVHIVGYFHVDEDNFNIKHINDWAKRNAPLILFPYLREQAHALTSRCGFKPLLLPLFEVPVFSLKK